MCECYAIAIDPERKRMWQRIFPPAGRVPLKHPLPAMGILVDEVHEYCLIDLERVAADQLNRLISEMSVLFNLPVSEIRRDINLAGIPVKASGVIISWCRNHVLAAS